MGTVLTLYSGYGSINVAATNIPAQSDFQKLLSQGNIDPNLKKYEILKENLEIKNENILGGGTFGNVVTTGIVKYLFLSEEPCLVAVKRSNPEVKDEMYFYLFLRELKLMSSMNWHENIVTFLGVAVGDFDKREIYLVLEYCNKGDLVQYLRANKGNFLEHSPSSGSDSDTSLSNAAQSACQHGSLTTENLLSWSYQIASGMEFLASKRIVHGDLIGKNILLTDKLVAKLGGFSIAKALSVDEQSYTLTEPIPLAWRGMAIETLKGFRFSIESDVWAYGIVLCEIFSLGEVPYAGFSWNPHFVIKLIDGLRPHPPKLASTSMYELMMNCWNEDPTIRPTFAEVTNFLANCLLSQNPTMQLYNPYL